MTAHQPGPLDGADRSGWTSRSSTTQDPSATVLLPGLDGSPARHAASPCICHSAWPWETQFQSRPVTAASDSNSQPDGARPQLTRHPPNRTSPQGLAPVRSASPSPRPLPAISSIDPNTGIYTTVLPEPHSTRRAETLYSTQVTI